MRVLVFLHSFEPGGVERVALRLCKAWVADGHDVKLVIGRADGAMINEVGELDYRLLSNGRLPTASWETLWMILRLPRVIRREQPDVLFCAGNSYSIVSVVMKLVLGRDCPPVVAKISNDLGRADFVPLVRWLYRRWLRIQARHIDRFVGMAPPMRAEIADAMHIAEADVGIVDDPALSMSDIMRLAKNRTEVGDRRNFISAGRLAPQKNFPLLLRAFALIARDDDHLTILGEGPERSRIEKLAADLGIAGRLSLPGHVTDLVPWLSKAEMFVLSSDYEGVPAVIAEALASRLAITATDCSVSIGDMLDDGRYGQIVPVRNIEALAAAMERSRNLTLDHEAMTTQATRFTVEKAADRYIAVFTETIARSTDAYAAR